MWSLAPGLMREVPNPMKILVSTFPCALLQHLGASGPLRLLNSKKSRVVVAVGTVGKGGSALMILFDIGAKMGMLRRLTATDGKRHCRNNSEEDQNRFALQASQCEDAGRRSRAARRRVGIILCNNYGAVTPVALGQTGAVLPAARCSRCALGPEIDKIESRAGAEALWTS